MSPSPIETQLHQVLRQSDAYSGDERVRKVVDEVFLQLVALGEAQKEKEFLEAFQLLRTRLEKIYSPGQVEFTPEENRKFLSDLIEQQYNEAFEAIDNVLILPGDYIIPDKSSVKASILRQLTNEQIVELRKLKEPTLLIVPDAPAWYFIGGIQNPECKKAVNGFPQKDPTVEEDFKKAVQKIVEAWGVDPSWSVKGYHFVLTEGIRDIESSAERFDGRWNQEVEMSVKDRIDAFDAYYHSKNMGSLNAPDYMVLMMKGLRQGNPIDSHTITSLPGEPRSAHMPGNGQYVVQGHWSKELNRVRLESFPVGESPKNHRLRAAVSGKISLQEKLPNNGELPPVLNTLDSYTNLSPEQVRDDLEQQHRGRLLSMRYFNLIDDTNDPKITDITGIERPAPSFDQIWDHLAQSPGKMALIKTLKKPKLILTPIGMSLRKMAEKVEAKNGRLKKNGVEIQQQPAECHWGWWQFKNYRDGLSYDETNDLVYFPQRFKIQNQGGETKRELLSTPSPWPGWEVVVMEGEQGGQIDDGTTGDQALAKSMSTDYARLTPEEDIMLHAEGVVAPFETGKDAQPFHNEGKVQWTLGASCKGKVLHWRWNDTQMMLELTSDDPGSLISGITTRRAIRIF